MEFSEPLRLIGTNPHLSDIIWFNEAGLNALRNLVDLIRIRRAMLSDVQYVIRPALRIRFEGNDVRVGDDAVYEPEYIHFTDDFGMFGLAISVDLSTGHSDSILYSTYHVLDKFVVDFLDFDGEWYGTSGELRKFLVDIYWEIANIHCRTRYLYRNCCQ